MKKEDADLLQASAGPICLLDCVHAARGELRQLMERWDNRLSTERLSFCEEYRKGRLTLVLKFKDRVGVDIGYAEFSAVRDPDGTVVHMRTAEFERHAVEFGDRNDRNQQVMLVGDVQIVESPEGVIPSLVRLDLVNYGADYSRGRHLHFSTLDGSFHFLSRTANGNLI